MVCRCVSKKENVPVCARRVCRRRQFLLYVLIWREVPEVPSSTVNRVLMWKCQEGWRVQRLDVSPRHWVAATVWDVYGRRSPGEAFLLL